MVTSDHLSDADQRRLLLLARQALEAHVRGAPRPPVEAAPGFHLTRGAFVTIHHRGDLRGCLGRLETSWPLSRTVMHLAEAVSDSDPRFPPVSPGELEEIDIEISVLTPERDIAAIADIEVGRHGLIVERDHQRGLLLPQVATEQRWDRETFLAHTCLKAGLPRDAWQHGARIKIFEAQVFGER